VLDKKLKDLGLIEGKERQLLLIFGAKRWWRTLEDWSRIEWNLVRGGGRVGEMCVIGLRISSIDDMLCYINFF
jgi:hypothetical protein